MAAGKQTLTVGIDADASGLIKATNDAAKALDGLKADVGTLDSETVDVKVDVDAGTASTELENLKGDIQTLDSESATIPVELEQQNIARDLGNLRKVLAGIEKQKASPDVDLDLTQLLKDEAKVNKAIDGLERRKVELSASMSVNTAGLAGIQGIFTDLREGFEGGGGGGAGLVGGLGAARAGLAGVGAAGAAAATGVGALAVGMVAAGKAAWDLGQAAADVETSVAQLDALVSTQGGSGEKVFGDLQAWAASTPFAIDDATEATKKLVAAGVPLKNLPTYLDEMGNVASATGVPLDQLATTFAQMESSGKASYENLQQLAEAGIPVWQTLSDKLDLSVGSLQDMAIKGQLPVETIKLLREELNNLYPSAMQDQSETFNGQMSTLSDNFDQIGQSLGTVFLPAMTDLVGLLSAGASELLTWAGGLAAFDQGMRDLSGGQGLLEMLSPAAEGVHLLGKMFGGTKDEAKKLGTDGPSALKAVQDAIGVTTVDVDKLRKAFEDTVESFSHIGADVRLHVSFLISKAQLEREIDKVIHGDKDTKGVTLPANLTVGKIKGLSDAQFGLVGDISSLAEQGLEEGARKAKVAQEAGKSFDAAAFYNNLRSRLKPVLIEAGIDPKQVNRVLTNVFGIPVVQKVRPEISDMENARKDLDAAFGDKTVKITPLILTAPARSRFDDLTEPRTAPVKADANTEKAAKELNGVAGPRTAPIHGQAHTGKADKELDGVAHDRYAHIKLVLDPSLYTHMDDRLDRLARTRTVTITGTGGGGGGAPAAGLFSVAGAGTPSLLSAATLMPTQATGVSFAGGRGRAPAAGVPVERAVNHLTPKQTPVQVYLDGAQIADHVTARTDRAATAASMARSA